MPTAALITAIIALILTAIATAPFFIWLSIASVPCGLLALGLGLGGTVVCWRQRRAGQLVTELRHALMAILLATVSLSWSILWLMLLVRGMRDAG